MSTKLDYAESQARAWLENLREMVANLSAVEDEDLTRVREDVQEAILESVLSVQVRNSVWHSVEEDAGAPDEFEVLLSTGGPALRIVGDLDDYGQPTDPRLEKQDWFTPWTRVLLSEEETADLSTFAEQFYFGERCLGTRLLCARHLKMRRVQGGK
jgi:hypothetical protein